MKKYTDLELKIKSMSAKEIILAMIDGLENPVMKVDMTTFGKKKDGVCYGCAATNTICKLGGLDPIEEIDTLLPVSYKSNSHFLYQFEYSIDYLRKGWVTLYNKVAIKKGFATITPLETKLPEITNKNYQDQDVLNAYRKLANEQ